jgi:hypothetical protein
MYVTEYYRYSICWLFNNAVSSYNIWRRMMGWQMHDKLEIILKEAVVV